MTYKDLIIILAQGNPGALSVLTQVLDRECLDPVSINLVSNDVFGSDIWIHYKDIHGEDIEAFCKAFGGS